MAYYHNSTFEIKPGARRLRAKKQIKRGGKLKRSAIKRSTRPMNKAGRRAANWLKAWRFLKPELEKRGRTGCEFRFIPHECWGPLDPAHSKKRRNMKGNDIYAVAIACRAMHNFLDLMCTHEQMELFVNQAIENGGGMILPEAA